MEHFELRVNLFIEETNQLRAQNVLLSHDLTLANMRLDGCIERLDLLSHGLELGLARNSGTCGEIMVQQYSDRRDLDRVIGQVQSLLMWVPWLNRVFRWWESRLR